ncbi:Uncharacterised protein [Mycobacteroides abscessus subsp. abscessus]|nr:Uncharacterised protein [Mycobacteroides abscessus subsp. abscessus]
MRGEELLQQIAVGSMDFHPVIPCFNCTSCGFAEIFNNAFNFLAAERARFLFSFT